MEAVGVKMRRKVMDITRKVGRAEDFFLNYFVKTHPGRKIVFCNSIDCARRLTCRHSTPSWSRSSG